MLSSPVTFGARFPQKSKPLNSLKIGMVALTALLSPGLVSAQPPTGADSVEITTRSVIPDNLKSNHQLTFSTCPDDGVRPVAVDPKLSGLAASSAEKVALLDYLRPRTAKIQIKYERPTTPTDKMSTVRQDEFAPFFRDFSLEKGGIPKSDGTGFVCQPDGVVLTNHHVVKAVLNQAGKITVEINRKIYPAQIIALDEAADLAVLKIDTQGEELPTVHFAPEVRQGEFAALLGFPGGLHEVLSSGTLSALYQVPPRPLSNLTAHLTEASVNSGNSGGAVFNNRGEVLGQVFGKADPRRAENRGYVTPIEFLQSALARLNKGLPIDNRLSLDSNVIEQYRVAGWDDDDIAQLDKNPETQALLKKIRAKALEAFEVMSEEEVGVSVIKGSDPSGVGDVIVAVNGERFQNQFEFQALLKSIFQGEAFELTIIRDGERETLLFPGK